MVMMLGGGAEKFKYRPPAGYSGLCNAVLPGKVWIPNRLCNTLTYLLCSVVCVYVCVCVCRQ